MSEPTDPITATGRNRASAPSGHGRAADPDATISAAGKYTLGELLRTPEVRRRMSRMALQHGSSLVVLALILTRGVLDWRRMTPTTFVFGAGFVVFWVYMTVAPWMEWLRSLQETAARGMRWTFAFSETGVRVAWADPDPQDGQACVLVAWDAARPLRFGSDDVELDIPGGTSLWIPRHFFAAAEDVARLRVMSQEWYRSGTKMMLPARAQDVDDAGALVLRGRPTVRDIARMMSRAAEQGPTIIAFILLVIACLVVGGLLLAVSVGETWGRVMGRGGALFGLGGIAVIFMPWVVWAIHEGWRRRRARQTGYVDQDLTLVVDAAGIKWVTPQVIRFLPWPSLSEFQAEYPGVVLSCPRLSQPLFIPSVLTAEESAKRRLIELLQRQLGNCAKCAYLLRGSTGPNCPECGHPIRDIKP